MTDGRSLQGSHSACTVRLVLGRRGMGKSTLLWSLTEKLAPRYANLTIFDPMICAPAFDDLAKAHALRLTYIEFDFDKNECKPPLPYGPPRPEQKTDHRNSLVCLDEVDLLCSPAKIDPTVRKLLHFGRHWNSTLLIAARRALNIHKDIEALATHIYVFSTTAPRDLDRLDLLLEGLPNTQGKPYDRERIRALPPFVFEEYQL